MTGSNVFEGASAAEICAMHLHSQPVPPSQRTTHEIPTDLEVIVMACLAKQPNERPRSAAELSEMLARCQGFGAWTQKQAQKWWLENRSNLPMEKHEDTHPPLSDTHLFVHTGDHTRT